ncbi:MAG: hypothetical protein WBV82_16575 [Myxococcaceae bacterium]
MGAFARVWMAAVCLSPAAVLAQGVQIEVEEEEEETTVVTVERRDRDWTVMGQAGVLAFVGEAARLTSPGPLYGIGFGAELEQGINLELAYQGSTYRTEAGAAGGESGIVQNGGQVAINLGPEFDNVYPFAQFGIQVSRLNVLRPTEAVRDATMTWLPMGVGLSFSIPSDSPADINIGARGTYNFTLDAGAFPTVTEPGAANQLAGSFLVGGRF